MAAALKIRTISNICLHNGCLIIEGVTDCYSLIKLSNKPGMIAVNLALNPLPARKESVTNTTSIWLPELLIVMSDNLLHFFAAKQTKSYHRIPISPNP